MKEKIMFDSNAFDIIIEGDMLQSIIQRRNSFDIYITDIQIRELAAIPDSKKTKRTEVFSSLCKLRPTLVPHSFTFDDIDFSDFSFEIEAKYWDILCETKSNKYDALIAATAIHEDCILVSDDVDLTKRTLKAAGKVISFEEFSKKYI